MHRRRQCALLVLVAFVTLWPAHTTTAFKPPVQITRTVPRNSCFQKGHDFPKNSSRLRSFFVLGRKNKLSDDDDDDDEEKEVVVTKEEDAPRSFNLMDSLEKIKRPPLPLRVDDMPLLLYDVFLLLNLSMSISFWVVHRWSLFYVGSAVGEGSLLCILWCLAGLYHGAFLYQPPQNPGMLGLNTYITTCSLRVMVALSEAVVTHRAVGLLEGEKLIPLEITCGLVLMSSWRSLYANAAS